MLRWRSRAAGLRDFPSNPSPACGATPLCLQFTGCELKPARLAEEAGRKRDLEHALEHKIKRSRGDGAREQRTRQRYAALHGEGAEHIAGGRHVHTRKWDRPDVDCCRDEERAEPLELAPIEHAFMVCEDAAEEIEDTSAEDEETGNKRKCPGVDAGARPADAVREAGYRNRGSERAGKRRGGGLERAPRDHASDLSVKRASPAPRRSCGCARYPRP